MAKPSFFSSVVDGAVGFAKGAVLLGVIGIVAGGLIGATIGMTSLAAGGALTAMAAGAAIGGNLGASLGALAGLVTGVAQGRDRETIDPQDVVNLSNMAFARGVEIGRSNQVSQETANELSAASREHRDRLEARQTLASIAR